MVKTNKTVGPDIHCGGSASCHRVISTIRLTKVSAAPFVFFSPPSSKLRKKLSQSIRNGIGGERTACNVWGQVASCIYKQCILNARQLSTSSLPSYWSTSNVSTFSINIIPPSCGRQAWSVHRNPTVYGRIDASLVRRGSLYPSCIVSLCEGYHAYLIETGRRRQLVTYVCFLQSLWAQSIGHNDQLCLLELYRLTHMSGGF